MAHHRPTHDPAESLLAGRAAGRGFLRQILDMLRLMLQRRGMGPQDYFEFALYDSDLYDDEERFRFVSDSYAPRACQRTAPSDWWGVGKDKVLMYSLLKVHGYPIPQTVAVVHPYRVFPDATALRDSGDLGAWLRQTTYPLFSKPVTGLQSAGQALLLGWDSETDTLQRQGEDPISVDDFVAEVERFEGLTAGDGHLFQRVLKPSPVVSEWVGEKLTGVRMVVMLGEDGAEITHVVWKIIVGSNFADNAWREGNLIADIDPGTGEVRRVVRGSGVEMEVLTKHPDTGQMLVGRYLPDWAHVRNVVLEGSRIFPKIHLQGWDVAFCDTGPVIVEANLGTGFGLMQMASGKGFMTPEVDAFFQRTEETIKDQLHSGQLGTLI